MNEFYATEKADLETLNQVNFIKQVMRSGQKDLSAGLPGNPLRKLLAPVLMILVPAEQICKIDSEYNIFYYPRNLLLKLNSKIIPDDS